MKTVDNSWKRVGYNRLCRVKEPFQGRTATTGTFRFRMGQSEFRLFLIRPTTILGNHVINRRRQAISRLMRAETCRSLAKCYASTQCKVQGKQNIIWLQKYILSVFTIDTKV